MDAYLINFIKIQAKDIYKGGILILLRKCYRCILLILSIPLVIFIRMLSPFVVIRLGPIFSKRIGHFTITTELYLCEEDLNSRGLRTVDIFYYKPEPICNYQLKKMWDRRLNVSRFNNIAYYVDRMNRYLPGSQRYLIPMDPKKDIDTKGLLARTSPHLQFIHQEEEQGRKELFKMGIPEDASFICFHARDSAYLDNIYSDYNWRKHDFRDCNIQNYLPALEELTKRGYFVIRMGSVVKEALNTANPKIIDYATRYRTEFLDIYLSAKCRFFIGSASGIDHVATLFRRPVAYVNFIPLGRVHSWGLNDLFIPKNLWLRKESRFLTFPEILNSGIGQFGVAKSEKYGELGIDVIENMPEEITNLVIEMDDRLNGRWQTKEEDEELQRCFWLLFKNSKFHRKITIRIGADFLRQNQELLEQYKLNGLRL